jgi:RNA polymerase sigma-70 factor (ECF subfamily)
MENDENSRLRLDMEMIWGKYYPSILGYFVRRIDNYTDAQDLASITMLNFTQAMLRNEVKHVTAYLWQVARNELADYISTKKKRVINLPLENFDQIARDSSSLELKSRLKEAMDCVRGILPESEIEMFMQIVVEKKTSVEIGKEMNLKPETVRKRLSRALQKIKELCIKKLEW